MLIARLPAGEERERESVCVCVRLRASCLTMGVTARFMKGIVLEALRRQACRQKVGEKSAIIGSLALGQARGVMYTYATHKAVF